MSDLAVGAIGDGSRREQGCRLPLRETRQEPIEPDEECVERQHAPAFALEGKELLALTAYIARQSRGLPIESSDERLVPFIAAGGAIFERRSA